MMFKSLKKYSYLLLLIYITVIYRTTAEWHIYSKRILFNMTTTLDDLFNNYVNYHGFFVYIYLSYFALMLLPLLLDEDKRYKMAFRMFFLSSMAHIIFLFLPSYIVRYPDPFLQTASYDKRLLGLIYHYDLNLNCFPTLHAAHVLLIAFTFPGITNAVMKISLRVWAILIALSTIIIRQHSVVDVIGAITIVIVAIGLEKLWIRRTSQSPE